MIRYSGMKVFLNIIPSIKKVVKDIYTVKRGGMDSKDGYFDTILPNIENLALII